MTNKEKETIVRFDEASNWADVYTASKRVADILIKRGIKPVKTDTLKNRTSGWYFKLPKHAVILKPGNRLIRIGSSHRKNR